MGRIEKSIEIRASPENVWEMIALDRFKDWDNRARRTMKSVEYIPEVNTPEDKCKVGASARITDDRGKQFVMEVKESLQNEKIVYYSELMSSFITYELEPVNEGTKLTKMIDYELPYGAFGKLVDKLFGHRMVGKETKKSFEQLKNILEKKDLEREMAQRNNSYCQKGSDLMSIEENKKLEVGEDTQRKNNINLNPVRRLFENPQRSIEPYARKSQVVADLGCNTGYYTLALAECVGPRGKVYAVDLKEDYIRAVENRADARGYRNIEAHVESASDLSFIEDESVDFVLANGLLCNMPEHRPMAVSEVKRILKQTGRAYLSLGAPPPLGFVDRAEWEKILEGFRIEQRGGFLQRWAVVSKKDNCEKMSGNYVETTKRHRFVKLRKWFGE